MKKVQIGNATIYHGKCEDVLKRLESESIDAVITDPPYLYLKHKLDIAFNESLVFNEWYRLLKDNSLITFFGRGDSFFRWNVLLKELGFNFKESAIWEKENASNFLCNFLRVHEDICIRVKGKATINKCFIDYLEYSKSIGRIDKVIELWGKLKSAINSKDKESVIKYLEEGVIEFSYDVKRKYEITAGTKKQPSRGVSSFQTAKRGKIMTSIIRCQREQQDYQHPTQKPVHLMEHLINLTTKENDIVLDSFMGGGSTGVACINTNRQFIGIECDDEYFNVAVKRISKAYEDKQRIEEASYESKAA